MRGNKPPLYDRLQEVQTALRRLTTEQGPRARKNARLAVRRASQKMLRDMDRLYSAPPKKVGKRKYLSDDQKVLKLVKEEWTAVFPSLLPMFVAAGVPVKQTHDKIWVPQWAWLIWKHRHKRLRRAVVNVQIRKALVTEIALTGTSQGGA